MRKLLLDPEARSAMGDQARRSAGALSWDDGARVALQSLSEAAGAERALAVAGAP
jgi:hypothetical protein